MTWKSERYFTKAQAYWERATARERHSEDFLLNVAFFCEFIIRGALCKVNPALNAASDTESILFASGMKPNRPELTISISVGLSRLARIIPSVTDDETTTVSALLTARNSELHGDLDEISKMPSRDVLPKVYGLTVKIADFSGQDLQVLLGKSDAQTARKAADASAKNRKDRVSQLIKIQKDRFFGLPKEEQDQKRAEGLLHGIPVINLPGLDTPRYKITKCPACASDGRLRGTTSGRSAPFMTEDGIQAEIRVTPDIFSCKVCDLEIKGLDELMACGFDHEFQLSEDVDVIHHFNIDPMEYVDSDQLARAYEEDHGYMDE